VVLTDFADETLQLIQQNISLNLAHASDAEFGRLLVRRLLWDDEDSMARLSSEFPQGFDFIIGSDLSYSFDLLTPLVRTLDQLLSLSPSACVILTHEHRPWLGDMNRTDFFRTLAAANRKSNSSSSSFSSSSASLSASASSSSSAAAAASSLAVFSSSHEASRDSPEDVKVSLQPVDPDAEADDDEVSLGDGFIACCRQHSLSVTAWKEPTDLRQLLPLLPEMPERRPIHVFRISR